MILDVCCGGRMFYFDKNNPELITCDIRYEQNMQFASDRFMDITPDVITDFSCLPFKSEFFSLVVFDPPHIQKAGENSWLKKKYGTFETGWKDKIKNGFLECMRVLKPKGTIIFKWNETDIRIPDLLSCFPQIPLLGHRTTKNLKTHWLVFYKDQNANQTTSCNRNQAER